MTKSPSSLTGCKWNLLPTSFVTTEARDNCGYQTGHLKKASWPSPNRQMYRTGEQGDHANAEEGVRAGASLAGSSRGLIAYVDGELSKLPRPHVDLKLHSKCEGRSQHPVQRIRALPMLVDVAALQSHVALGGTPAQVRAPILRAHPGFENWRGYCKMVQVRCLRYMLPN